MTSKRKPVAFVQSPPHPIQHCRADLTHEWQSACGFPERNSSTWTEDMDRHMRQAMRYRKPWPGTPNVRDGGWRSGKMPWIPRAKADAAMEQPPEGTRIGWELRGCTPERTIRRSHHPSDTTSLSSTVGMTLQIQTAASVSEAVAFRHALSHENVRNNTCPTAPNRRPIATKASGTRAPPLSTSLFPCLPWPCPKPRWVSSRCPGHCPRR